MFALFAELPEIMPMTPERTAGSAAMNAMSLSFASHRRVPYRNLRRGRSSVAYRQPIEAHDGGALILKIDMRPVSVLHAYLVRGRRAIAGVPHRKDVVRRATREHRIVGKRHGDHPAYRHVVLSPHDHVRGTRPCRAVSVHQLLHIIRRAPATPNTLNGATGGNPGIKRQGTRRIYRDAPGHILLRYVEQRARYALNGGLVHSELRV